MFPDADMPGVDLVLPDFTYLRENADRVEGVVPHPRARGPRRRASRSCCATSRSPIYGSPLSLGLARNRIEEAGMLGRTELIPVHDGERRMDRAVRLRVHPGDALGAARVRDRVPHAGRHDPPQRRLQARPHAGRRPQDRPRAHRRDREAQRRHQAPPLRLHQRGEGPGSRRRRPRSARAMRNVFRDHPDRRFIVASFASHLHRVQQVVRAAVAAGRTCRVPRSVDGAERRARAARWVSSTSRPTASSTSKRCRGTRRVRCA